MNIKVNHNVNTKQDNKELALSMKNQRIEKITLTLDNVPFSTGLTEVDDIMYIGTLLVEYEILTGRKYKVKKRKIL